MFNPKTLFALNKKDQDAIVFTDANGEIIRLTSADFESKDTFRRWKSWYMKRLKEEENENHTYADNTLSVLLSFSFLSDLFARFPPRGSECCSFAEPIAFDLPLLDAR